MFRLFPTALSCRGFHNRTAAALVFPVQEAVRHFGIPRVLGGSQTPLKGVAVLKG